MNDRQIAFQDRIDARFPYDDPVEALTLILEARRISPEAVFAVLHEICVPPRSARAGRGRLKELLAFWRQGFEHPLEPGLSHCAEALIDGRSIPGSQAAEIMRDIASHRNAYNALAVVERAAGHEATEVEALGSEIRAAWRAREG